MNFVDIANLAEYGVAVVSIGALVYVVTLFARFVKTTQDLMLNHISESTKASQKLYSTIDEMLRWLRNNH